MTTHSRSFNHPRNIGARALLAAAALTIGVAACGSDDAPAEQAAGAEMAEPWSRQPAEGQTLSAVYGELTNTGDEPITAVAATTDVAERVELHETTMADDGQMSMNEKAGGYTVEPGDTLSFVPGGPHIMLFDVDAAAYPDTVAVNLQFSDGSSIDFTAEVRAIGDGDMEMDEGGTDMDDGDEEMQRDGGETDSGEMDSDG